MSEWMERLFLEFKSGFNNQSSRTKNQKEHPKKALNVRLPLLSASQEAESFKLKVLIGDIKIKCTQPKKERGCKMASFTQRVYICILELI